MLGDGFLSGEKERIWTRDFVLISLSNFVLFIGFQILLPTLPVYAEGLGGNDFVAGLIIGIFTISAVAARPYAGFLMDKRGRRGVFLIGLTIFILSAFLYNWTVSILLLLLLRIVHGIGWAAATTASGTIASDIIPVSRRGEGMGYYGMWINVSMAFAPALGLFLIEEFNFTTLFMVSTGLGILSMLVATKINYQPVQVDQNSKVKAAIVEKSSFKTSAVLFFLTFVYGGIVTFLALYAHSLGISIDRAGVFFTVYAMVLLVTRPIAGRIFDVRGPDIIVIPGLIITALSMIVLGLAESFSHFIITAVLLGIGFGAVQPSLQALTINLAPAERRGAANATFFSAFDLGISAGAVSLGIIASFFGYANMYLFSSLAAVIGLIMYLVLLKGKNEINRPDGA